MITPSPRKKRLFLFAGYNKNNIIDDALVYYIKRLFAFGDVVLVMDSDCPIDQMCKISEYTLYASGTRHGEYDFGSYKRGYIWATENLNLPDYDFIYLVNDSVYGPLFDMAPYFSKMESLPYDAFGLSEKRHKIHRHIQSWFVGLRPSVFCTDWFDVFMRSITKLVNKGQITILYEQGLSHMITEHGLKWGGLFSVFNRDIYNGIEKTFCAGIPFIKKDAFTRHNGALGMQILYVLNHISPTIRNIILRSAGQQYGDEYINWLLTYNPVKILLRNISYMFHKLSPNGG